MRQGPAHCISIIPKQVGLGCLRKLIDYELLSKPASFSMVSALVPSFDVNHGSCELKSTFSSPSSFD